MPRLNRQRAMIQWLLGTRAELPQRDHAVLHIRTRTHQEMRQRTCTFTQCARKLHEFAEITQNNGHYAVQGHSRSPILVPIESSYTISYE